MGELNLRYKSEEDLVPILIELKTENVDSIDFDAIKPENGPLDAANVCDIIAKILDKPNLKQIGLFINFDHDLEYKFLKNYEVKTLALNYADLTMWIWKEIIHATPNLERFTCIQNRI